MIYAARGETQSFQGAVHASGGKLTGLNFSVSNCMGFSRTIAAVGILPAVSSRKEPDSLPGKVHDRSGTQPNWNGPPNLPITNIDTFPDALIPFVDPATGKPPVGGTYIAAPLNVAAVHNAVFWVDVVIPRDA